MLLVLGAMAYFLSRSKKKQTEWITAFSQSNGYQSNTTTKDFVYEISADNQLSDHWSLRGYSRTSSTENVIIHASREYTEWEAIGHFEFGETFLMPRDPSWKSFTDEKILSLLKPVWIKMGIPADDFIALTIPNETIMKQYMIFSSDQLQVKKLLTKSLLQKLDDWMKNPINTNHLITIHTTANQIQLQTNFLVNHPEQAELMIQIGLSILNYPQEK